MYAQLGGTNLAKIRIFPCFPNLLYDRLLPLFHLSIFPSFLPPPQCFQMFGFQIIGFGFPIAPPFKRGIACGEPSARRTDDSSTCVRIPWTRKQVQSPKVYKMYRGAKSGGGYALQLRKKGIINSRSKGEGGTRGTRKKENVPTWQVQKRREKEGKVMLSLATLQYMHTAL